MAECVACYQPLEIEVDSSDDEDVEMGESSTAVSNRQKVPDDVHLVRNTWSNIYTSLMYFRIADAISTGTVYSKHTK